MYKYKRSVIKVKKFLNCFITIVLTAVTLLPVQAEKQDRVLEEELLLNTIQNSEIIVTARNTVTGETIPVEVKPLTIISTYSDDGGITVGYEAFVPMENSSQIMPLDSGSSDQTRSGATAKMTVTFYVQNEKIKTTNFSGSWSGNNSLFYFTNRLAGASAGQNGSSMEKYPNSNSFSYNTNWGYVTYSLGDTGPYAWSEATAWISGMEQNGGIELSLQFQYVSYWG